MGELEGTRHTRHHTTGQKASIDKKKSGVSRRFFAPSSARGTRKPCLEKQEGQHSTRTPPDIPAEFPANPTALQPGAVLTLAMTSRAARVARSGLASSVRSRFLLFSKSSSPGSSRRKPSVVRSRPGFFRTNLNPPPPTMPKARPNPTKRSEHKNEREIWDT